MKSKINRWTARIVAAIVVLTLSVAARGQNATHKDKTFRGVINAYTPQTTTQTAAPSGTVTTVTGPYEVRGPWSLKLSKDGTKAEFSAALNMEFSDGWVLSQPTKNFDPTLRNAHTHHITLTSFNVTPIANGFEVTGIAMFTLSGNPAPPTIMPSNVVINITGGTEVEFSNITLTFLPPGSNHFGSAPLPGVVRSVKEEK